jgi:STE24 endopeptidase
MRSATPIIFAIHVAADLLNLRALRPEAPGDFRDLYDTDRYQRTQAYTRERTRVGLIASSLRLTLLLAFWLGGGFGLVDRWTRALGWPEVPTGLAFVAALLLGQGLVRLPFSWYSTFVVEEQYGFNRTTPRTFWIDVATGVGLAAALGGPLLAAILWLFGSAGLWAWLWCWALVTAWTVGVQYVAPTWIMPLFNRFTSLPDGALRDALLSLAERVGFPLAGVWVIDGSKRSSKANSFFTGFGSHKRIALFDTLLATLAPDEVLAVVAHEIGHYKAEDYPSLAHGDLATHDIALSGGRDDSVANGSRGANVRGWEICRRAQASAHRITWTPTTGVTIVL